jgi:hypothetical protein
MSRASTGSVNDQTSIRETCEMIAEMLAAKAGVSAWWYEPAEGRS